MRRHLVLWFVVGVIAWNLFNFFARSANNYARSEEFNRYVAVAPNVDTPSNKPIEKSGDQPAEPSKPTVPPTPLRTPPPTPPTPLVIPKVPVPDNEPAIWYGKNRPFNHSLWKIFPVPRLINFPANGKYLEEGLKAKKAGTLRFRFFNIFQDCKKFHKKKKKIFSSKKKSKHKPTKNIQRRKEYASGYSLGASQFPADCPFQCDFNSDKDAIMVGSPGLTAYNRLKIETCCW